MNPFRLLAPLAALAAVSIASALDTAAWEFRQTVPLDRTGAVRLTLPLETLDSARADLSDLRLLGPDGAEIPFAIVRRDTVRPTTERIPLQGRLDGNVTIVEFGLAKTAPIQRIRLDTPAAAFVKAATVEIEAEPGRWQHIVDSALVFRMQGGMEQLAIDLHGAQGRTIRVSLDNGDSTALPITAVVVETGGAEAEQLVDQPVAIVAAEQEAGSTRLTIDLGRSHLPLAELVLAARENVFQRPARLVAQRAADETVVEDTLASGTFARLVFPGDRSYAQLALPVETVAPAARLELVIDNADSPPLSEIRLVARLRRVDIGFSAPAAGTYTLLSGNSAAEAPRYDVAAFAADWGRLPSTAATAAPRAANPGYRPAQLAPEIPEFGGPIDSTKWSQRRSVRIAEPGAQILELDAAALALARADLADLRLMRDGRQVPYLLEHTSRVRTAALELTPAPDAKRPTVGRWELALPVAGMPVDSLRLTIAEPLFARTVVVGEIMPDSHGRAWPRILGSASIQRRNLGEPTTFTIPLSNRPQTGKLFVEIDHGDNAAFSPTKAETIYPVRRLRFRARQTAECTLLYGNPAASAPRYDLQLAAPRLLSAVQHTAVLDAADGSGRTRALLDFGGPVVRYIFWGALALVVVFLVWLVAKLLPKPPAA
jgi:hypothetical protein